jgi:O-methyltransferase
MKAARKFVHGLLYNGAATLGFGLASYRQPHRIAAMDAVRDMKRQREMLLTPLEAYQLCSLVKATSKIGGAMAEIGVYRGASARLIREADLSRDLHLFDTFEGLPETRETDTVIYYGRVGRFEKGEFSSSFEDVQRYLSGSNHLYFHKGLFPETALPVCDVRFSFVHSDVDIYESSKAVLEFFYPRMLPGGIIVTHDFASASGVNRAFTEFFASRPEPLFELAGDQAAIVML